MDYGKINELLKARIDEIINLNSKKNEQIISNTFLVYEAIISIILTEKLDKNNTLRYAFTSIKTSEENGKEVRKIEEQILKKLKVEINSSNEYQSFLFNSQLLKELLAEYFEYFAESLNETWEGDGCPKSPEDPIVHHVSISLKGLIKLKSYVENSSLNKGDSFTKTYFQQ